MADSRNPSPELWRAFHTWRRRRLSRVLAVAAAVTGVLIMVVLVLGPLSWVLAGGAVRRLSGRDQADALNAVRQTLLTALAGTAVLGGLVFTARTYELSRRGQVTGRFSAAISHLASDKLEERLGGVFALEHIMAESPRDHATVLEVLCAFIRNRAPKAAPGSALPPRPAVGPGIEPDADVDAAMTVLARRPRRPEPNRPDLRHVSLIGLSLRSFEFTAAPNLTRVFLTGADLRHADLRGLDLSRTILTNANLHSASLHGADFTGAVLCGADLGDTSLHDCVLTHCDLTGTDLSDTRGLSPQQLSAALIDDTTILPAPLLDDPWALARVADCQAWMRSSSKTPGERGPSATAKPPMPSLPAP